jgi:hypothetical protein
VALPSEVREALGINNLARSLGKSSGIALQGVSPAAPKLDFPKPSAPGPDDGTFSADCYNLARTQQHHRDLARAITSALSENNVAEARPNWLGSGLASFGTAKTSRASPAWCWRARR